MAEIKRYGFRQARNHIDQGDFAGNVLTGRKMGNSGAHAAGPHKRKPADLADIAR